MSEGFVTILNVISIILIFFFASWVSVRVVDPFSALYLRFIKKEHHKWDKMFRDGDYYSYFLIIILISIATILTTQLGIGNVKARLDVTFFINCTFWIVLPLWAKKNIKKNK